MTERRETVHSRRGGTPGTPRLHLRGARVAQSVDRVPAVRGSPQAFLRDDGPQFIGRDLAGWADAHGIRLHHIQSGKANQNVSIERVSGQLATNASTNICSHSRITSHARGLSSAVQRWPSSWGARHADAHRVCGYVPRALAGHPATQSHIMIGPETGGGRRQSQFSQTFGVYA